LSAAMSRTSLFCARRTCAAPALSGRDTSYLRVASEPHSKPQTAERCRRCACAR
jgi:hypothetical protein